MFWNYKYAQKGFVYWVRQKYSRCITLEHYLILVPIVLLICRFLVLHSWREYDVIDIWGAYWRTMRMRITLDQCMKTAVRQATVLAGARGCELLEVPWQWPKHLEMSVVELCCKGEAPVEGSGASPCWRQAWPPVVGRSAWGLRPLRLSKTSQTRWDLVYVSNSHKFSENWERF